MQNWKEVMAGVKPNRLANDVCSMARAMEVMGDRWTILIMREAYYGITRFDEFEYYVGAAPNILSTRLKKLVEAGVMARMPLPEHAGRFEYVLTKKGRDFFPAYLALKKWSDDWLAEPSGPQVVFVDRSAGRPVELPPLRTAQGKPLRLEDVEVIPGSGAVPFNRKRFAGAAAIPKQGESPTHPGRKRK